MNCFQVTARPSLTLKASPGAALVVEREHRGVDEVVDVAEARDGAAAVDQQHVAAADRARDLADDVGRAGPVDGRRAQDHGVQRLRRVPRGGPRPRRRSFVCAYQLRKRRGA